MIPKISVGQKTAVLPNLLKQPKGIKTNGKIKLNDLSLTSGQLNNMMQVAEFSTVKKVNPGSLCETPAMHGADNLSGEWCA